MNRGPGSGPDHDGAADRSGGVQAIVLDFDGVIADSEPLHFRALQAALADGGLTLTSAEYYERYLGYDDLGLLRQLASDRGLAWSAARMSSLADRKERALQELLHGDAALFPGAAEFIRRAASAVPIAIASGALRHEILEVVGAAGLSSCFAAVVAAGDTAESKPSPAPYRLALTLLRQRTGRPLDPRCTVAVEDSRWGLASARGAGLRCVGVTSSYPAHELPGAELAVSGLGDLTLEMLDALCASPDAQRPR